MPDSFGWYELMTPDPAGSQDFYTKVVGWSAEAVGASGTGSAYTIFKPQGSEAGVAGMQLTPDGAKPSWIGYIHVSDVDSYVAKVEAAGGRQLKEPVDVPGMLRFIVFADPQGAPFILFTPTPMEGGPPPKPAAGTPQYFGWSELVSTDGNAAWDFYSSLFGWTVSHDMDMGPMGIYRIWASGGEQAGAVMTGPPDSPAPFWNYYINVDSIDAAIVRLTEAGGTVIMGPHEVPGPMWIVQGTDPQGIMFSLVSSKP